MALKVLIVDDEADLEILIRERFRRQIKDGKLDFVFAANGHEALAKLKEDAALEIVMSDINMPIMDGLTLLSKLPDIDRVLKMVIVSAYGDMPNIRTAMNRGAYDFLTKPIDFRDFEVTLNKAVQELETIKEGLQAREQLTNNLQTLLRICRELSATRSQGELQERLLENVFDVVPADGGAILLFEDGADQPSSTFTLSRDTSSNQAIDVDNNLVQKVLADRNTVLLNSALVVPLFISDRTTGVIYLKSLDEVASFDEDHLQFVIGAAATASIALENVRQLEWLQTENRRLKADFNLSHAMVGESARMKEIYRTIAKVAPSDSTVLILGESGTGKELAARAIHSNSPRSDKPFIAINCAALSETLLESDLFGHEKGAFTGAVAQKKGKLEIADGGTVFLDEVGELTPATQAKLLRVLQERQFERVGGIRPIKVNIRIIAASNRDFQQLIAENRFRLDLYYRLNVVSLKMPSLKERREDIPALAQFFVTQSSKKAGRVVRGISHEARQLLVHHDWPGNVREMENAIERAVVLGTTESILAEDLPESVVEKPTSTDAETTEYHRGVLNAKKQLVLGALNRAAGNYTQAAKLLGLHPNNLHRLVRDLDLKQSGQKDAEKTREAASAQ
jgi:DNA-binding NtrC family response regulator